MQWHMHWHCESKANRTDIETWAVTNEWLIRWIAEWMVGWIVEWMVGWIVEWMVRWNGQTDGQMQRWLYGQTERHYREMEVNGERTKRKRERGERWRRCTAVSGNSIRDVGKHPKCTTLHTFTSTHCVSTIQPQLCVKLMESLGINNTVVLKPHKSSARKQKGLTDYGFKYIDRPFCLHLMKRWCDLILYP